MSAASFGTVGLGATLAGGLLSSYGASKEGAATKQMYDYRAQVAKINADIERQNAAWARDRGEKQAEQYGMKAAQQRGQIIAAQGASNIEIGSGSSKAVRESQQKITAIDMGQIRSNAAKVAYDYETKAFMDENQGKLDTFAGEQAEKAGKIKAMGSILGTVSGVSTKWQQGKSIGLWD